MRGSSTHADMGPFVFLAFIFIGGGFGLLAWTIYQAFNTWNWTQIMAGVVLVGAIIIMAMNAKYYFRRDEVQMQTDAKFSVGPALDEYDNTGYSVVHNVGGELPSGTETIHAHQLGQGQQSSGYLPGTSYVHIDADDDGEVEW